MFYCRCFFLPQDLETGSFGDKTSRRSVVTHLAYFRIIFHNLFVS